MVIVGPSIHDPCLGFLAELEHQFYYYILMIFLHGFLAARRFLDFDIVCEFYKEFGS